VGVGGGGEGLVWGWGGGVGVGGGWGVGVWVGGGVVLLGVWWGGWGGVGSVRGFLGCLLGVEVDSEESKLKLTMLCCWVVGWVVVGLWGEDGLLEKLGFFWCGWVCVFVCP